MGKSFGFKMAELNQRLENDYSFKAMSKIHFHLRTSLDLQVIIYSRENETIDQKLEI